MSSTPIIPGFHPDPSICRVGNDYYIVNSSFEYQPGVPVFHSRDLRRWELIGNVLDRDDQLHLPSSDGGGGIYAPTIRYHNGRFWMITTDMSRVRDGLILVSSEHATGPWSEVAQVAGTLGIDPDLFWDTDGTCWVTWVGFALDSIGILQAQLNPDTGGLLTEPRKVWQGSGLAHPEGPHIYLRGGWYYCLLAEGGTERGHAVTIARSRTLDGPYESNPANPILTHRSTALPVQNTGHADLVELADGGWAMVYLGVRPVGPTPSFHLNGRETFIGGVRWVDDWPIVDEEAFTVPEWNSVIDEDFSSALSPRWIAPGLHPTSFVAPAVGGGVEIESRDGYRALLATRVEDQSWEARARVEEGTARLVLRVDDNHWAAVESVGHLIQARAVIGPVDQILGSEHTTHETVELAMRSVPEASNPFLGATVADKLELGYSLNGEFVPLATIDGRYFSTEVAGGFTGRVVGIEPLASTTKAIVRRFTYGPLGTIHEATSVITP